jgi:uncharacterized membrane protein YkvA (DUF1232 family)
VSKHIETFKSWVDTYREDVTAVRALIESDKAHADARKLAAASLSYLVTRMDLVPDWNEGIGALDDVMVIRVCMGLASANPLGDLPGDAEITLAKLGNDAERIYDFLGGELYDKLKAYCAKLTETSVRGRTPANIVADAAARTSLYADVDEEMKRQGPVVIKDPADAELKLKAYLKHKLG